MSPAALDHVADAVNPLLGVATLAALILSGRRTGAAAARRLTAGVLIGVALVYAVKAVDQRLHLWAAVGLDYSTHSAVAASLGVSLVLVHRPLAYLAAPLLVGYAWLMLHLHYHTPADILVAAVLLGGMTWLAHRVVVGGAYWQSPAAIPNKDQRSS